jgi:hypothetical protein
MVSVLFSVLKRTDMRPTPFSFRFNTLATAEAPFTSKRSSSKSVLPSIDAVSAAAALQITVTHPLSTSTLAVRMKSLHVSRSTSLECHPLQ